MVTIYRGRQGLSRRELLKRGTVIGAGALLVVSGGAVLSRQEAWGLETAALKPEEMATLIVVARDIYPHDHVADRFYAVAMKAHDEKAAKDPAYKALIADGIAELDRRAGAGGYTALGWEADRVALLKQVEATPFFQTVRGGMVVGLYNQKDLWPLFGYEGESYSKGGYIARGFNDIDWL